MPMDFMTSFPYWGIIVVVIFNTILVLRQHIEVEDSDHNPEH